MSGGSERRGCPFAPSRRAKRLQSGATRLGTALPIGILALVALAASAGSVAWLVVRDYDALLVTREVDRLGEGGRHAGRQVRAAVDDMRRDALFLADTPAVRGVVRAGTAGGVDPETGLTEARWRAGLAHVFSSLARAKPDYLQVRLIGVADDGRELVRVDRDSRGVHTIAPEVLQAKGSRPYFREAVALDPGRVYVSPLEMNRERGGLDPRMLRVVRASTPVYGPDGRPFGAIVIKLDFGAAMANVADFADSAELAPALSDDAAAFVTDQRGVPLLTLTRAALDRFGPPTGAEPIQDTLVGAAGLFAPEGTTTRFAGEVALGGGAQIAYLRKVGLDPDHPDRFVAIGALVPRATVLAPVRELHRRARGTGLFATGLFLLVASGAGLLLVRMRRQVERRDARLEAVIENAITDKQRDFLGELMNVGSASAATALARILATPVSMEIPPPRAWPDAAPTLLEELGSRPMTCAAMETTGDVPGVLLFLLPEGSRKALTELLSGGLSGPPDRTEAARAAVDDARIRDVADILSGVFLTATHRFCGLAIHHSAPVVTMGEGPALLRKELAGAGGGDAPGLLIEARFTASSRAMRVHMLVAPRPQGLEALAGSLEHALSICLD